MDEIDNFGKERDIYSYPELLGAPMNWYKKNLKYILHRYNDLNTTKRKERIETFCNRLFNRDDEYIEQWCETLINRTPIDFKTDHIEYIKRRVAAAYTELQQLGFTRAGREKIKDPIILCLIRDLPRGLRCIYPFSSESRFLSDYDTDLAKDIVRVLTPDEIEQVKKGRKLIATKAIKKSSIFYVLEDRYLNLIFNRDWFDINKFECTFPCEQCEKRECINCAAKLKLFIATAKGHFTTLLERRDMFWKDQRKRDHFFALSYICSLLLAEKEMDLDILKDQKEICNIIGLSENTYYRRLRQFKELVHSPSDGSIFPI